MLVKADSLFEHYLNKYREIEIDENIETLRGRRLPKILEPECKEEIEEVNAILSQKILNKNVNLTELQTLTYCGAKTVIQLAVKRGITVYYDNNIPDCFSTNSEEQEILYKTSPLQFRNLLFLEESRENNLVEKEKLMEFWSSFWKNKENADNKRKRHEYLQKEEQRVKEKEQMKDVEVSIKELNAALKSQKNWSVPGIDGLQMFWYKKFSSLRVPLLNCINRILSGKEKLPNFFMVGLTELTPKNSTNEEAASNFRPITRLPTIYKIISKCMFQKVFQHFEKNEILPSEQTGDRKGCFGARKALIIDSIALEQEKVFCYYTDFKKAFDTVSHDWLLELFRIYKVSNNVIDYFVKPLLENMRVRLYFKNETVTETIFLERGIFQGDPMSVLFFWTVLTPLSSVLNEDKNLGLALKNGGYITHLLYLDDLKIYSSSSENLEKLFEKLKTYVNAVNMELNLNKTEKFQLPLNKETKKEKKYLGYIANPKVCHQQMIQSKFEAFKKKSLKIQSTTLKEEEKFFLKRKYLFAGIFHTFGFLNWSLDIKKLWKIGEAPEWQSKKNSSYSLNKKLEKYINGKQKCEINKNIVSHEKLIELKLLCDVIKIRSQFFKEKKKEFIRNAMLNDEHSILKLSQEKKYFMQTYN